MFFLFWRLKHEYNICYYSHSAVGRFPKTINSAFFIYKYETDPFRKSPDYWMTLEDLLAIIKC